uniref:Uncharacterized protein n=1 Tax=Setaria viridis TaxID=4556 RepID=A0A4U6WH20_SETVI|nr:hypothetical protein SEVIR_1G366150v2 [Setaria viridis]
MSTCRDVVANSPGVVHKNFLLLLLDLDLGSKAVHGRDNISEKKVEITVFFLGVEPSSIQPLYVVQSPCPVLSRRFQIALTWCVWCSSCLG